MPEYRVFNPKNGDALKKKFKTRESAQTRINIIKNSGKYFHANDLAVMEW